MGLSKSLIEIQSYELDIDGFYVKLYEYYAFSGFYMDEILNVSVAHPAIEVSITSTNRSNKRLLSS